ncbi:hypothetical protein [Roseateles sp. LYH14W]|uniref:Sel1 repeat family protein n=1 Tax=Pelomonas parva TaxID=3299032 RepID=A0ABW7F503_9BURK
MKIAALTLLAVAFAAQAQDLKYDPNSPAALEAKAKYDGYERDGKALKTLELYKELERLDVAKKFRMSLLTKPEEMMAAVFSMDDNDMRAISYSTVLQKRGEAGDPYASFYFAVRQWDYCVKLDKQTGDSWAKQAKECWQGAMPAFKRASDAQIADATFNIARLYQNGFGVTPSKLAAAEWFVKAADQYNKQKDRDEALTALESALNLVPDHPAALRLRKAMLK